jgi:hypothetical protein
MAAKYQEKIITLWAVFLLGTLFHTQLGLMPLFHNQSIALSSSREMDNLAWILWSMFGFFVVPMIAMIATLFDDSKRYRKLHFGVTIFYSAMNLLHIVADLLVKPIAWYQIALMAVARILPQSSLAGTAAIIFFGSGRFKLPINSINPSRVRLANLGFHRFSSPIVDTECPR